MRCQESKFHLYAFERKYQLLINLLILMHDLHFKNIYIYNIIYFGK